MYQLASDENLAHLAKALKTPITGRIRQHLGDMVREHGELHEHDLAEAL